MLGPRWPSPASPSPPSSPLTPSSASSSDTPEASPLPLAMKLCRWCCQHYLSTHIRPWFNQFTLQWTVFKNPINITTYQLNQFRSLLTHEKENLGKHEIVNFYGGFHQCCTFPVNNFRPAQPVNGRAVQLITTSSPRWCSIYHPSSSNRSNLCVNLLIYSYC